MSFFSILKLLLLCVLFESYEAKKWQHHEILDDEGKYHLYWRQYEDHHGEKEIAFKVVVEALGYVGFGLSPTGHMEGSDIVTGWVKHGQPYFQDRHATRNGLPQVDKQQDWILTKAGENCTHTILEFRRKLNTCDDDDMVIDGSTFRVIYSYSDDDPRGIDPMYHCENRGSKSLILLRYQFPYPQPDPYMKEWVLTANNFDISAYESIYWCKIFKSPQFHHKHHVVHVETIIEEGHEHLVHHLVLYECVDGTPEEFEGLLDDDGYDCSAPNGNPPPQVQKCDGTVIGWGHGGGELFYPHEAGLALEPSPRKYYKLEIHYDNPQRMQGMFVNSGIRVFYTPHLRKYDSSALFVGSTVLPRVFIPPRLSAYTITGHSNPDCFDEGMSPDGIKIYGGILHAHATGAKIVVRHFRGKEELCPIAVDNNYDSHYQAYRYFKDGIRFLPGDQLTVECTYNTTTRYTTTFGGQTSREEMCVAMLFYYPAMNRRYLSLSGPTLTAINKVLDTDFKTETDVYALFNYNWTTVDISEVEYHMRNCKHYSQCWVGNGERDAVDSKISYPKDYEPYVPPEPTCDSEGSSLKRKNHGDLSFRMTEKPIMKGHG